MAHRKPPPWYLCQYWKYIGVTLGLHFKRTFVFREDKKRAKALKFFSSAKIYFLCLCFLRLFFFSLRWELSFSLLYHSFCFARWIGKKARIPFRFFSSFESFECIRNTVRIQSQCLMFCKFPFSTLNLKWGRRKRSCCNFFWWKYLLLKAWNAFQKCEFKFNDVIG